MKPPRALWVPFILGRPLGQPNDAAFQRRVLRGALDLLERPRGDVPILVDHTEEADGATELDGRACPVNYAPIKHDGSLANRLADEIVSLATWYELSVERTGRTVFGSAAMTIGEVTDALVAAAEGVVAANTEQLSTGDMLRLAGEDLKAWVTEAATAQPGNMTAYALKAWFWEQTVAGETLLNAYQSSKTSDNKSWRDQAPVLIPAELR
ncbi:MAG: hypothetical protein GWP47_15020 [Actinobacteria bacterium]|nr:hypothetical protein [Actinomycetota bacterium]